MKVKLAIDTGSALVRIRSKSRVKRPKLLTESAYREETSIISPVTMQARNATLEKERPQVHRQRSCSKLHCEHKPKKHKEVIHEDEYYNTGTKRREWQRERDEILRENERLRRENKVLNDYFAYMECKDVLASRGSVVLREKEKLFSFKEMQEGREFHGAESKTHKTSITKANSKMQYLEEFY